VEETFSDALASGDRDRIKAFLELERDPAQADARNGNEPAALFRVLPRGDRDLVALLLAHGAKPDAPATEGWTALHVAAARNLLEIGELLLQAGANPNALSDRGMAPLHVAAAYGNTEFADLLLRKGADVNLQPPVKTSGSLGNSPLHWAALRGHTNVVSLLLAKGADLRAADMQGRTPAVLVTETAHGFMEGFGLPGGGNPGRPVLTTDASRTAMLKLLAAESPETRP
jgi:ankyrin repeat protein